MLIAAAAEARDGASSLLRVPLALSAAAVGSFPPTDTTARASGGEGGGEAARRRGAADTLTLEQRETMDLLHHRMEVCADRGHLACLVPLLRPWVEGVAPSAPRLEAGDARAAEAGVERSTDTEAAAAAAGVDGAAPPRAARRLPSAAVQLITLYFYLCTSPPPSSAVGAAGAAGARASASHAWSEATAIAFIDKHGGGLLDLHHAAVACNRRTRWSAASPHANAALALLLAAGRSRYVARAALCSGCTPPFMPSASPSFFACPPFRPRERSAERSAERLFAKPPPLP